MPSLDTFIRLKAAAVRKQIQSTNSSNKRISFREIFGGIVASEQLLAMYSSGADQCGPFRRTTLLFCLPNSGRAAMGSILTMRQCCIAVVGCSRRNCRVE